MKSRLLLIAFSIYAAALMQSCAPSFTGYISHKPTNEFCRDKNIKVEIAVPTGKFLSQTIGLQCMNDVHKVLRNRLENTKNFPDISDVPIVKFETKINQKIGGAGYLFLTGFTLFTFNIWGMPIYTIVTDIVMTVTIRNPAGEVIFKEFVQKSEPIPIGIYYRNNLENNRGITIELVNDCIDTFLEYGILNELRLTQDIGDESLTSEIDRASLNKSNTNTADITFNQVPKDIVVNTVAVLPIDGKDCNGKSISGQDIASYTEGALLGIYNIVERRNLERVLDEQKLALSGIVYEKSAVEAGCNVGAQGIIFTEYGCLTGQETIQLKLVDCQTSELYWSATGINATAKQVLDKVREELEKE